MKTVILILCALMLSACVTEDGVHKHKNRESGAVSDGMQWHGIVYAKRKNQKDHDLGILDSRQACMDAAKQYMQTNKKKGFTYSCGAVKKTG